MILKENAVLDSGHFLGRASHLFGPQCSQHLNTDKANTARASPGNVFEIQIIKLHPGLFQEYALAHICIFKTLPANMLMHTQNSKPTDQRLERGLWVPQKMLGLADYVYDNA